MSEKEPASTGPKPKPPKQEWENALERLQKAYEPQPEVKAEVVQSNPEAVQAELGSEVNAVEDIAVEETPETAAVVETAALEAAFAEPSAAESAAPQPQPAEKSVFNFVDKRNAESQAWSKENKTAEASETTETPTAPEAATPKRGELTHHDYHAQRPADGSIYRAGKTYQRASGGSEPTGFVKNGKEEYDEQNGVNDPKAAEKHYNEIMGLNEAQPATPERPAYETMDTDQLVFAAAKAELIGDAFVTNEIRETFEEAYTRPGSEMTSEEYESATAQFDHLLAIAVEYEKAKDPEHHALVDAAVERANKEPSIGDKLKGLWSKGKETVKKLFRHEYWGERFNAAANKLGEASAWALNLGVNEEDTDAEKDKKRNRNRVLFVAGGAALAVATIAGVYGIGFAVGGSGHHGATEALSGGGTGGGHGAGDALSAKEQAAADALTPGRGTDVVQTISPDALDARQAAADAATAATAAEAAKVAHTAAETASAFNISSGEGGLELFNSLHIDPQNWYANQESFLRNFPNDFYRMPGGGVGIGHQGLLSEAARNAIEALK
ncbi:MAG TPA: hypothetical protein VIM31_05075 [Candidatus Microsaccharimonas sp.]|jgi:hypothetical protein